MRLWQWGFVVLALSCGDGLVPSPFGARAGEPDAGAPEAERATEDAGAGPAQIALEPNQVLGWPCVDDAQCDDGLDCTFGACDLELGLCRLTPDDGRCADAVFCNGVERCDARLGCRPGPPTSCSDSTPCTIDHCDEATQACVRVERDVDGDGDVDGNCRPGADCNDLDPLVASTGVELCANQVDDDCDGGVDEADCRLPEFDTCADALSISGPGSYQISPAGAALDYGSACATAGAGLRELVIVIEVAEAPTRDIEIVVRSPVGHLALARAATCGAAASEPECQRGAALATGESVSRLRLFSPAAGSEVIYLYTDASAPIQLEVSDEPASVAAQNRTCDGPSPLVAGESIEVDLALSGTPLPSLCSTDRGDLFYQFSLDEAADVQVFAESLDDLGDPRLALLESTCRGLEGELRCAQRASAALRVRALPAGTYVLAVSASGPTRARLSLDVQPPTTPPVTDQCNSAPALGINQTQVLGFLEHDDDIAAGCGVGFLDTARRLELTSVSDVLVVARFSSGDVGAVALARPECRSDDTLGCTQTTSGLARVSARSLAAGEYRVVTESLFGLPATLTTAVRPARAPSLVPASDGCDGALTIGAEGGFYQGNTANAVHDFSASCDFATPVGAPDQLLRLVLDVPRRVLLDMRGSDFDTLLDLRRGPACPGEEVERGCSVLSGGDRSFVDLDLPAGDYFIQIDGFAGASGNWFLNVFVMEP